MAAIDSGPVQWEYVASCSNRPGTSQQTPQSRWASPGLRRGWGSSSSWRGSKLCPLGRGGTSRSCQLARNRRCPHEHPRLKADKVFNICIYFAYPYKVSSIWQCAFSLTLPPTSSHHASTLWCKNWFYKIKQKTKYFCHRLISHWNRTKWTNILL